MGTLFGFVVGYVIGARAGSEKFDEVVDAVRAIRESQEFSDLVGAVTQHVKDVLGQVSDRLAGDGEPGENLLDRARARLSGSGDVT